MRLLLSSSVIFTILSTGTDNRASAFVPVGSSITGHNAFALSMASAEETLARAKAALGKNAPAAAAESNEPKDSDPTLVFSADLLEDMRISLELLGRRASDGPGSLTVDEIDDLDARTRRIVDDMLANAKDVVSADGQASSSSSSSAAAVPPPPPPPQPKQQEAPPAAVSFAVPPPPPEQKQEAPAAVSFAVPPPPPPQPVAASSSSSSSSTTKEFQSMQNILHAVAPVIPAPPPPEEVEDISEDDGPAYDGTGGMGMAKGTVNTYVIPGMDEMTGEEYREALQKSVSDRQAARRRAMGDEVGNKAANGYLDQLGYGGASAALSGRVDDD